MVRAIITWSLHNRLIVLLGVVALIVAGIHSAQNLNVEAYPDPTPPLVEVITQNPGASPEEMERLIGIPIETALNGMPGLEYLRSTSISGLNDIKCQFKYGTDYWQARQELINRLAAIGNLPAGVTPGLSPWSPIGEIVRYVLEGPGYTTRQLKAVQDWVLNRAFKQVPGVIDVTGYGGTVKQYQILVDTRLMKQYGVTMEQVEDAIKKSNANVGGDILALGTQSHNVRAIGLLGKGVDPLDPAKVARSAEIEARKLDDIRKVVVDTSADGTPIFVRQIAQVVIGHQPRLGIVGRGTEDDVVEGIVLMRKYEKSLPTAEAVAEKMREIEREQLLPKGMKLRVFNQRTDLVEVTTHNVLHNLVEGMILVIVVLFVFLGDLASAGIVAIMIPLALLFSVTVLYVQGKSANLLSIGAVDFGIIVDSSVIIVENIYRHITAHDADRTQPLIDRIIEASYEIERSLFFSTTIIVCAFIPLFAMTGPEGALFGPMASTYAFAIFGALLLALTLAPVLCSFLLANKTEETETFVDRMMKRRYLHNLDRRLEPSFSHPGLDGGLAGFHAEPGAVAGRRVHAATRGRKPLDSRHHAPDDFAGGVGPDRSPAARGDGLDSRGARRDVAGGPAGRRHGHHQLFQPGIQRPLEADGRVAQTNPDRSSGIPVSFMWNGEDMLARTITREEVQDEMMERFREEFPALDFSFSQLIRDNVEEALSGVKGANSVKLFGSDLDVLEKNGEKIANILRSVPGIQNVGVFHIVGQPNLEIEIDREACARYGINVADVESNVKVAIGGEAFSQMVEGEKLYDIVLRLPHDLRDDPGDIAAPGGRRPRLRRASRARASRCRIWPRSIPTSRAHRTSIAKTIAATCRSSLPFRAETSPRRSARPRPRSTIPSTALGLPPGYRLEWSGEFAQMEKANARLMWIVPISIGLIMVLLYTAFSSLKDALLVMVNVVAATMGGVWALKLTGTPFSISAAVGFISIFGVAVQDGVL